MPKRLWSGAIIASSAFLLASCASSNQVSIQSGGMTHTFTEGKSALSKDFPLPVYPGAQPAGSVASQNQSDSEQSQFLMLSTPDSVHQVEAFYRQELAASGWQIEQIDQIGSQEVNITCAKKAQEGGVSISGDDKKTFINLQMSKASLNFVPAQENNAADLKDENKSPATD